MKVPGVSEDGETPVVDTCGIAAPYRFAGSIGRVRIDPERVAAADLKQEEEATAAIAGETASTDRGAPPTGPMTARLRVRDRQLSQVRMGATGRFIRLLRVV